MSAGDEDLWAEIRALRHRLDAAEAVLAIHELKARYGELVDSRFERGRRKDEAELARIAEAGARHAAYHLGAGRGVPHGGTTDLIGQVIPRTPSYRSVTASTPAYHHRDAW